MTGAQDTEHCVVLPTRVLNGKQNQAPARDQAARCRRSDRRCAPRRSSRISFRESRPRLCRQRSTSTTGVVPARFVSRADPRAATESIGRGGLAWLMVTHGPARHRGSACVSLRGSGGRPGSRDLLSARIHGSKQPFGAMSASGNRRCDRGFYALQALWPPSPCLSEPPG